MNNIFDNNYNVMERIKKIQKCNIQFDHNKCLHWQNDLTENIKMTVALPIYNAKNNIAWLALKSLENQIELDFKWELIIMEENGNSIDIVKEFIGKLPNCINIIYLSLTKKIYLIEKWKYMALISSDSSTVFVLHAVDCYSPPKRLKIHNEHFKNKGCFFSTQCKGLFYNCKNKKKIFYNGYLREKKKNFLVSNHLNMALRLKDIIINTGIYSF
jgi:hypothetical protein